MSVVAAVDLGSNSFHMVLGREDHGQLTIVDRLREPVRLAAGLDARGRLTDEAIERALRCLERFGERLRGLPPSQIRAVGTNTFRRAKGGQHFLSRARGALGVPIEILPGPEEARLIFLGVSHGLAQRDRRRLVVDIGGGSTECIIGDRFDPLLMDSLQMGCVAWTRQFFSEGAISGDAFSRAELAARVELEPIVQRYRNLGWQECVGSSGTIRSAAEISRAAGWSDEDLTRRSIHQLKKRLIAARRASEFDLPGMSADRAPVLAGGVAILAAVFESFELEQMAVSNAALREGLLYDLIGRIHNEDVREGTIESMSQRYHTDREQSDRVERTAAALFAGVATAWKLDEMADTILRWGARLHEVGMDVAYSGYHRHGEYLLTQSNMPGFSRDDQRLLATLVRCHRGKLRDDVFEALPPFHRDLAWRLSVLLRLAVILNRARGDPGPEVPEVTVRKNRIELVFPSDWLEARPLTRADLMIECELLDQTEFELRIR